MMDMIAPLGDNVPYRASSAVDGWHRDVIAPRIRSLDDAAAIPPALLPQQGGTVRAARSHRMR